MNSFSAKFAPGERVSIGDGSILGTVECVKFGRNKTHPVYEVEWISNGNLVSFWFHEQDLTGGA